MYIKICPVCHHENSVDNLFCEICSEAVSLADVIPRLKDDGHSKESSQPVVHDEHTTKIVLVNIVTGTRYIVPNGISIIARLTEESLVPVSSDKEFISRRKHLKIIHTEEKMFVIDEGSSNGSFANGENLAKGVPLEIKTGDIISLGDGLIADPDARALYLKVEKEG